MAAVIEQSHDENGIIWPLSVAPYHVIITVVSVKKDEQIELGEKLYKELSSKGIEVLLDDRKERPGVKFKDADLIGIPIRITVGRKANENIVEFVLRRNGEKIEVEADEAFEKIKEEFDRQNLKL